MRTATDILHNACALYRLARSEAPELMQHSYLLHIPHLRRAWLGIGAQRVIEYTHDGLCIRHGEDQKKRLRPEASLFAALRAELDAERPCFFLVSNDLARASHDPGLPLAVFIQPEAEITFDTEANAPLITPADNNLATRINAWWRRSEGQAVTPAPHDAVMTPTPWFTESDEHFLQRLHQAIGLLHDVPGKMILTRGYEADYSPKLDPLRLYEIYTALETEPAASHYATLPGGIASLGCSPENIFEIDHDRLRFDVIAATRGISTDPEEDRRWRQELQQDPKEVKEHRMALERYRTRLEKLCVPGSALQDSLMDIRTLRCVRHLHSRLSGRLRPDLDTFDLLDDSFPPLNSYPAELIPMADPDIAPTRYYGGMVGRIGAGSNESHCFLNLRAALTNNAKIHTQGGVGVIADSIPKRELLEVNNKLRCLMRAVDSWKSDGG